MLTPHLHTRYPASRVLFGEEADAAVPQLPVPTRKPHGRPWTESS